MSYVINVLLRDYFGLRLIGLVEDRIFILVLQVSVGYKVRS